MRSMMYRLKVSLFCVQDAQVNQISMSRAYYLGPEDISESIQGRLRPLCRQVVGDHM
jgi:hypothetical protein